MLPITDLYGNQEHLTNIQGLKRKRKVNGERTIGFFVLPDESNAHSFGMVETESIIEFDGEEYIIKQVTESGAGKRTIKKVEAVHKFFNDMINSYQYEQHSGSMTFNAALSRVFGPTPYTYAIVDQFTAESFENFGRDNCLSLFKRVLERYGAEFYIVGNQVRLVREIGNKTDFQYRYAHNIQTIDKEVDTSRLATIIRGYGGEPDVSGNYPIQEEYISPNIDVFGELHAAAVYDERYTTKEGLKERLIKDLIDEPQMSLTIKFADLRASGYNYNYPSEGDYGYIIYEPMDDLDIEARIVEIEEEFDYNLDPIDTNVTLSNLRYNMTDVATRFNNTSKTVERILRGDQKLPYNVLADAVKVATEALKSAQTELEFNNGIIARDKNNPNLIVLLNSKGIGISTDGGSTFNTAMTGHGVVADVITSGSFIGNEFVGGLFRSLNGNVEFDMETGILNMYQGGSIRFLDSGGGVRRIQNGRSAVLSFAQSSGNDSPMVGVGVVDGDNTVNLNSTSFRGIRFHSDKIGFNDDIISERLMMSSQVGEGAFLFRTKEERGIIPQSTGSHDYQLGSSNNKWKNVFLDNLRSTLICLRNPANESGWCFTTQPEQGQTAVYLYGNNQGNNYTYNLGRSANPMNFGYIDQLRGVSVGSSNNPYNFVYANNLIETSDFEYKEEIVPNELGLDFINELNTVDFKLTETGQYKNGLVAQETIEVLEKYGKTMNDHSIVAGQDEILGVSYTQLIAPLIKSVQELSDKVEVLENQVKELEKGGG